MSLATSIKEFSDILNQIYTANELNGTFSYLTFIQELFIFSIKNLIGAILYILTFNWLRDFSYLPLLAPQLNPSSYFEDFYFEDPLSHILSFSRVPALLEHSSSLGTARYGTDQLISGFINSFFFSLPFSLPHLISMRRFLSQGVSAGVTSVLGTIAAHSLFLIGVLYGLRFLIIPWFSVEPLNYIVGILILVAIVNELVQEKKVYIVPRSKKVNLLKIGALNFMLTWCEESTVFHSFNHLTLNAHNTYLDLYPSGTAHIFLSGTLHSFIIHTTYLLAFILGNCLFSFLFYSLFLQSTQYISQWSGLALAKVARTLNKVVLFLIVAFTLSSFPYYGLDYLLGKVGGFLPEDPAYMETILSPTVIRKLDRDFSDQTTKNGNKKKVVPLDVNYFDQGVYLYLETPLEDDSKEDFISNESSRARGLEEEAAPTLKSMESKTSFEELNYRGEYAWTFHGRYKKNGSKEKTGFLSGIAGGQAFKKPKSHYMELKVKSDKRQAEAASQAADQIPLGRISEWKEGVLPRVTDSVASSSQKGFANKANRVLLSLSEPGLNRRSAKSGLVRETPITIMEGFMGRSFTSLDFASQNKPRTTYGAAPDSAPTVSLNPELSKAGSDRFVDSSGRSLRVRALKNEETTFASGPMNEYVTEMTESISPFEDDEGEKLLPIENLIKARYIFNPVYRTLLKTDIDAFLARQPSNHNLAANQEYNLAKKRQLLEKYYNWLRYYSPFEKELEQLYEIPQTKSFVDSVYHQQFKGTLQIARRLFSVTFDSFAPSQSTTSGSKETRKQRRVLSYDQTLYTESKRPKVANRPPVGQSDRKQVLGSEARVYATTKAEPWLAVDENPFLHEQLLSDKRLSQQPRATIELGQAKSAATSKSGSTRVTPSTGGAFALGLPTRLASEGENKTKSITTFEDLESSKDQRGSDNDSDVEVRNKEFSVSRSPFIEESNSSPVYAGWDDTLRQFVVTNKFNLKEHKNGAGTARLSASE